jgi:hypothetical protein
VDDPAGLKAITAISVDKHTRGRITARRPVRLMIVGRTPGRPPRLLGLVKASFGTVLAGVRRGLEDQDRHQLGWTRFGAT